MKPRVVVLSGRVCSGKSTLASLLRDRAGGKIVKSKNLIYERLPHTSSDRQASQRAGERLDRETGGRWVAEALNQQMMNVELKTVGLLVIDSIRIADQVHFLRKSGWLVVHVHLEASDDTLTRRFESRSKEGEPASYAKLAKNWTERRVNVLADIADVVIDTDRCNSDDVFARVVARLEIRPVIAPATVDILIGGQYGSEGKGNIAAYLAPEYSVLVRVGGPNAGHKVFRSGAEPYTFRQLPSGTLHNQEAKLVIGAGAVIGLDILLQEIAELAVPYHRLLIDPQAMIINSKDIRQEEKTVKGAIGSTAQGIGAATARKINNRSVGTDVQLVRDTPKLKHFVGDTIEYFAQCLSSGKRIMLEGTQGTTLSLHHGFYPHVTSRATTAAACMSEAGIAARHVRRVVMVCRTYPIRVGDSVDGKTSGHMSQPIDFKDIAERSGIPLMELENAEVGSVSHRPRRVAEFDWAQLRRSMLLNGPTDIALTFADYLGIDNRKAYRYEQLNDKTLRFIEEVEKVSGVPVSMISTAFNERNIIDRRMW